MPNLPPVALSCTAVFCFSLIGTTLCVVMVAGL